MKKIFKLVLLIVICLLVTSFKTLDGYSMLVKSFEDSGLELEETKLSAWIKLNDIYNDKSSMEKLGMQFYNYLSDDSKETNKTLIISGDKVIINNKTADKEINITIYSPRQDEKGNYLQIAMADITQHDCLKNIIDIRKRLFDCFSSYGEDPHISICINGSLKGQIDRLNCNREIQKMLDGVKPVNIRFSGDDKIISAVGYTPAISDYINCGGEKININASCRYSSYDDKTYFLLGTPVIISEY